jgi:MoaA/NifB/PqqE/SkfB family radical SAM enzyme
MNFSIIVPGGCNAKCSFCFWEEQKVSEKYMADLIHVLDNMPVGCALSITGGEPTLSPYIDNILLAISFYKYKFEKVILTTNGTKLYTKLPKISGIVDHINISRHHHNKDIRNKIFGINIIDDEKLKIVINECNMMGIDVTFNAVLCGELKTKEDVLDFINYSKDMDVSAITFRKDYNVDGGLEVTGLESYFKDYKANYSYSCPVCRTKSQIINGLKVTWKSSAYEPSIELNDMYELVFHPSGKLTIDWAGKEEIAISNGEIVSGCAIVKKFIKPEKQPKQIVTEEPGYIPTSDYSSCGGPSTYPNRYSGCGGLTSSSRRYSGCGGSSSYTSNHSGCGGPNSYPERYSGCGGPSSYSESYSGCGG